MDCNFYAGRLCIMMQEDLVEETDIVTPCERCDIPSMWWAEKDKQLALRDAGEIESPLERKLNELPRVQTIDA